MSPRWVTLLAALGSLPGAAPATAQVLVLGETDPRGKPHAVAAHGGLVDVNSRIKITLNRDTLRARVLERFGAATVPPQVAAELGELTELVRAGTAGLDPLENELLAWAGQPAGRRDPARLQAALGGVADPTVAMFSLMDRYPEFRARAQAAFNALQGRPAIGQQYATMFAVATAEVERLRGTADRALQANGVFVQLGAWILTGGEERPIHLPRFDRYPEGEFFEVERFNFVLTEEHRRQFEAARDLAGRLSSIDPVATVRAAVERVGRDAAAALQRCVTGVEDDLRGIAAQALQPVAAAVNATRAAALDAQRTLDRSVALFQRLPTMPADQAVAAVAGLPGELEALRRAAEAVRTALVELDRALAANAAAALARLEQTVSGCVTDLEAAVLAPLAGLRDAIAPLVGAGTATQAVAQLGEDVLRHDLGSVPPETEFTLLRSGPRRNGDRLRVVIAAGTRPEDREIVEERMVRMYQTRTYGHLVVGLIFAHPTESGTDVQNYFQPAPAYNVLLKFGGRSAALHGFWRPGIGINISALDFNHDDTPEMGLAAVFSLIRDYAQAGVGYNMGEDAAYWFFGLRLPAPAFTLGGVQNGDQGPGGPDR